MRVNDITFYVAWVDIYQYMEIEEKFFFRTQKLLVQKVSSYVKNKINFSYKISQLLRVGRL